LLSYKALIFKQDQYLQASQERFHIWQAVLYNIDTFNRFVKDWGKHIESNQH